MAKKDEMIEVIVVTKFKDKENGKKLRKVGEVFEVTKKRYEEIVAAGKEAGVEYVAIPAAEVKDPDDPEGGEVKDPETAKDGE